MRETGSFLTRAGRHPSFVVGGALSLALALAALVSAVWSPYPPAEIDIPNKLAPPSAAHWLGTDSLGRDIASLLIVGARYSIAVGLIAVGIGITIGVALGLLAAARRGWVEEAVMRLSDFTLAFPALLTAIMLTAIYGPGLVTSIVAIGIFNIPEFARITRASARIAIAKRIVACTMITEAMFGSTCSIVMRHAPLPQARAASTNSRVQMLLADARAMRANSGMLKMPIATIEVTSPGP